MYIYLTLVPVIFIVGLLVVRKFSSFFNIHSTDDRISAIVSVGAVAVFWPLALPLGAAITVFFGILWLGLKILGDSNAN